MADTIQGPVARSKSAFASTLAADPAALARTVAALAPSDAPATHTVENVPSGAERFVPGALLGEGGMGRVLVADDRQFGRRVALKEMHPGPQHPDAARRFAVEALVTGNLEHPGIPAVYERGVRDGALYYAMRRVEGRPLSDVIEGARTLKERLAILPVIVQVANTLGFAHERGVVHRDVKPANVLVAAHGEVVLLDWGIAKVRDVADAAGALGGAAIAEGAAGATVAGSVLGTPAYMAPEQARGDVSAIDERTDVFALGAMLYHVLSGRAPYEGPTSMATLSLAIDGRREPLSKDVPQRLREIAERAMAPRREDRFANADELAKALASFMTDAVAERPSVVVRAIGIGASVLAMLGITAGLAMTIRVMPSFQEQGMGTYVFVLFTALGLVLSATEWRTAGRYRLTPLAIALACATVLFGTSATFLGWTIVIEYVRGSALAGAELADTVLQGFREASGNLALSATLAALQALAIGLAARSRVRS